MDFEYAEDDLPLPSFKEVFGESTMSKNKKKKASKMGADETIGWVVVRFPFLRLM